jgi:hypothetical protein
VKALHAKIGQLAMKNDLFIKRARANRRVERKKMMDREHTLPLTLLQNISLHAFLHFLLINSTMQLIFFGSSGICVDAVIPAKAGIQTPFGKGEGNNVRA